VSLGFSRGACSIRTISSSFAARSFTYLSGDVARGVLHPLRLRLAYLDRGRQLSVP
jgi:hypothetical protein